MEAKKGDKVRMHYKGMLTDGTVFDSSEGKDPIEFTIGSGQVISGFDSGAIGMVKGVKKTITIKCEDAYGPIMAEAIQEMDRKELPADFKPVLGQVLQFTSPDGLTMQASVKKVTEEKVTIDVNHPLAGQDLVFEMELVSIN